MDSLPFHPARVDKSQPAGPWHETLQGRRRTLADDLGKPETLKTAWSRDSWGRSGLGQVPLASASPRTPAGDLADLHAHRQAGEGPEFLLWHTGSSSCFNVVFQEALQILLPPEASTGHKHWAKIVMNGRSRRLRALTQEGRCVAVRLGLPPLPEAGSRFPIPYTLLDHPPAQTVEAHNLLYSASSLTPPAVVTPLPSPQSL